MKYSWRVAFCLLSAFAACNSPGGVTPAVEIEAEVAQSGTANAGALRARAREARAARRYAACAAGFSQAAMADALSRHDGLHAAECSALAGRADRALAGLEQLVAEGFAELERLDTADFTALRGSSRWSALVARAAANRQRLAQGNPELARLYADDQGDRKRPPTDVAAAIKRDEARRLRVSQIMVSPGLRAAEDYFCAAMIFQHGDTVEDYRLAHSLALMAAKLAPQQREARWLAAASKDRELRALGKPQLYGTQFRAAADGSMEREPTSPSVTDQERLRWGVPPLSGNQPTSWALGTAEPLSEEW